MKNLINLHNILQRLQLKKEGAKILALAGSFNNQCEIYQISPELDLEDYPNDKDLYEILDDVEKVFKQSGINIMSNEDFFEACIDEEGTVHGATVISSSYDEDLETPVVRFSVAVAPDKRNAGVARKLVESVINSYNHITIIEAYVINPHMVPLLESLSFESDGEWSEYNPIMRKV